jgi:hypothetical protein
MLEDADLDVAVQEGIVTGTQATALRELARRRERARAAALGHEERFRFLRGFNDVFFAIGVVLFVGGSAYFVPPGATGYAVMAALVWGLAEVIVGRMRLVLPGILLASAFVVLVFLAATPMPLESGLPFELRWRPSFAPYSLLTWLHFYPGGPLAFAGRALIATGAAAAFYWRFKLPFALLPLAASLVVAALGVASALIPQSAGFSDAAILLVCGLAVFAAAMAFDASDRERLTRRADCAFWLHLLAAPMIMHSAISLFAAPLADAIGGGAGEPLRRNMSVEAAIAVILIVASLALVAILADRRALLVSGLAYLGGAIGYALTGAGAAGSGAFKVAATLVILGALVLSLGVGWVPLRRRLLALLSPAISDRLPPVPALMSSRPSPRS